MPFNVSLPLLGWLFRNFSHCHRAFLLEVGQKEVGIFLPLMVVLWQLPQRPPAHSVSHMESF